MIIESGVIILAGLLFLALKLKRRTLLLLLGYPFALDLSVTVITYIMHYGTFSGAMAAAVAGLMCSGLSHVGRWAIGYTRGGVYTPGRIVNYSSLYGSKAI